MTLAPSPSCDWRDPQGVRRLHRPARHPARGRAGRVRLLPRPLGLRQDHAAAHHRRARSAERGHDLAGRARHLGAAAGAARLRHRVPVVRAVPQPDASSTTSLTAWSTGARSRKRSSRAGSPSCCTLVGLPDAGAKYPEPALRRPAAAHRARAGARDLAGTAAAGRAAVGARRDRARAPAPGDPRAAAAPRRHHHHGDARPGRGALDGRPHRGDEPGRDRAGRHAARDLPRARHAVRRGLRRQGERARRRRAESRRPARRLACSFASASRNGSPAARCRRTCGPRTSSRGRSRRATPTCSTRGSRRSSSSAPIAWCASPPTGSGQPLTVYLSLNFLSEQNLAPGSPLRLRILPERCACSTPDARGTRSRHARATCRCTGPVAPRTCCSRSSRCCSSVPRRARWPRCSLQSVEDAQGAFVGLANFVAYLRDAGARCSRSGTASGCRRW